ncbi:hypothetical protein EDB85DRAFT_1969322 [Lactarius pseudohatsudake]|nr:hypothetical protein EDB85DRAFT_1969322 [Lactarius pseudohatsudake]
MLNAPTVVKGVVRRLRMISSTVNEGDWKGRTLDCGKFDVPQVRPTAYVCTYSHLLRLKLLCCWLHDFVQTRITFPRTGAERLRGFPPLSVLRVSVHEASLSHRDRTFLFKPRYCTPPQESHCETIHDIIISQHERCQREKLNCMCLFRASIQKLLSLDLGDHSGGCSFARTGSDYNAYPTEAQSKTLPWPWPSPS